MLGMNVGKGRVKREETNFVFLIEGVRISVSHLYKNNLEGLYCTD